MNRNTFFTADWHIGHIGILKYSNRPFKDLAHMHRVLVNNYNATVGVGDICYFLGDIGRNDSSDVLLKTLKRLHGIKILILGNHDKPGQQFWQRCGFSAVMHSSSLRIGKNTVTMSHCPLYKVWRENTMDMRGVDITNTVPNWHGEEKNFNRGFSLPNWGQFHLHGHIHSPNGGKSKKILDKQYDVGVDANGYRPVSISTIESWVAKYGN